MPRNIDGNIEVQCNGAIASARVKKGRASISCRAVTDEHGVMEVRITSPRWIPHELGNNSDFRILGCAIDKISFIPEKNPESKNEPLVSVIIPTYNRSAELLRTLAALLRQTWSRIEVVVVDDGSTDDTQQRLADWEKQGGRQLKLRTLRQDNSGPGRARNRGLDAACGSLILFIGDDTCPAPDMVEKHVAMHRRLGEPCAVVGFTDWDRGRWRASPFLEYVNLNGEQFGYGLFRDGCDIPFTCLYTSNLSLPREVLGDAPFSGIFRRAAWEDAELGYRLSRKGLRIVYCAAARSLHYHPMSMRDFLRRQAVVGEEVKVIYDLHPELVTSDVMPPFHPPRWIFMARSILPLSIHIIATIDRLRIRLPARVYRGILLWAYFRGRDRARRERWELCHEKSNG